MPERDAVAAQRAYFDRQAATYDDYTRGSAWTPHVYLADVLGVPAVEGSRIESVLDLGTGTGQTLQAVRGLFPQAELWGCDVSPAMLARAATRLPDAQLVAADLASYVGALERSFDLVTAIGCAELVADLPAVLTMLAPHVVAGGHVAVTVEPLVDGLGVDLGPTPIAGGGRPRYAWSSAQVLDALPGGRLVADRVFRAYERAGIPVLYQLLLVRMP